MTSRFDNLEFESVQRKRPRAQEIVSTGTPQRDAAYFHQVADEEFRGGMYESALRNYTRALEDENTRFGCWLGQIRALIKLREFKEAGLWTDKALELFPEHPELLAAKALSALHMGSVTKALAYSDGAMEKSGATPFVWLVRATILLARGSRITDTCFAQALGAAKDQQERAWLRVEISQLLRSQRRYTQALLYANDAVQEAPRQPAAWLELGCCQAGLGLRAAAASFEQALQLRPGWPPAEGALQRFRSRGFGSRVTDFFRNLLGR